VSDAFTLRRCREPGSEYGESLFPCGLMGLADGRITNGDGLGCRRGVEPRAIGSDYATRLEWAVIAALKKNSRPRGKIRLAPRLAAQPPFVDETFVGKRAENGWCEWNWKT